MNKQEVKDLVRKASYFDFEEEGGNSLIFSTRVNGDRQNAECRVEDFLEGLRIKKALLKTFNDISISVEDWEEWVILTVTSKYK